MVKPIRTGVFLIIPIEYIPFIYATVLSIFLVNIVPRNEIRRLFIYGLIFGGVFDVVVVGIANLIGEFKYINYEQFGLFGLHFMAPFSWTVFFIMYFYYLPRKKIYIYLYTTMGVFYSILFCQMITKLGVLELAHGLVSSIIPFVIWFPAATWGYLKLSKMDNEFEEV